MKIVLDRTFGKRRAKCDVAIFVHGASKFEFAQSAFELRVKMRKGLRIVPDMRAGTMTAAGIGETTFPTPDIAIFQAQHGGRFENRQIGGNGIENVRRQSGVKQRFLEGERARAKGRVVFVDIK